MQALADESKSKRLIRKEVEDRISSLPDELRTQIISLLPFESAFKTCVLSRSWKQIFANLPKLLFVEQQFPTGPFRSRFFSFLVDWTLNNYEGSEVDSLEIRFNIVPGAWVLLKNAWIDFAVEHNVQYLKLTGKIDVREGLPSSLFTCGSLKEFSLTAKYQPLILPLAIYLPNLTTLSLSRIGFPEDLLTDKLFAGCPLLTSLSLKNCTTYRLERLTISCPKLKVIYISHCVEMGMCVLDIHGPCVESFSYEGGLAQSFEFRNMHRLCTVALNITSYHDEERKDRELAPVALNLLRSLSHATEMTISPLLNEFLTKLEGELWQLNCFKNLKTLCLFVWATAADEKILTTFLSRAPCVQKLRLIIHRPHVVWDMFDVVMRPNTDSLKGLLSHLKYLQIDNFEGFPLEIGFLEYFLQNAKSLTEVIIRIPQLAYTQHGDDHYHCRKNEEWKPAIVYDIRRLSDTYPGPVVTIKDVCHTILW